MANLTKTEIHKTVYTLELDVIEAAALYYALPSFGAGNPTDVVQNADSMWDRIDCNSSSRSMTDEWCAALKNVEKSLQGQGF